VPEANVADLMNKQSANLVEGQSLDVVWINQQDDSVSRGGAYLLCLNQPQASYRTRIGDDCRVGAHQHFGKGDFCFIHV
jgi:geranylgeranyl pyrophosphate synthase